jgi:hypothetical protein
VVTIWLPQRDATVLSGVADVLGVSRSELVRQQLTPLLRKGVPALVDEDTENGGDGIA